MPVGSRPIAYLYARTLLKGAIVIAKDIRVISSLTKHYM